MTQNYINLSRWIRRAAQCTMLMLTLLICVLTSQAQNLTVTVNGSTTVKNQASLQAAIATSTIATNDITSISVSAGTFTTADWNYLSTIGNLTTFEITNGISSAADVPDHQFTSAPIENITLHKVKTIGNSAFFYCLNLSTVNLPNALNISGNTFVMCSQLTFVDLPQATNIGNAAFFYCTKLTSIHLPKVTTLNKGAFVGCSVLSKIELPSITNIVANAFQDCSALKSIYLPKATSIGETAFDGCSSLNILGLGATAPTVGANAFQGCPAERILMLIDENNQPLTGVAQINAANIYKNSSGWSNNQWYGWKLNAPYFITLETTNGTVSLPNSCINLKTNTYAIPDGLNNIVLTLAPNNEHVLKQIDAFETGNASNKVTLTGNENTRSFAMPNHNVTIQTIFSLKHNISATVSPDHSGSISGTGDYFDGESVTLKATPAEGYSFVGWKEGNSTVSSTATYTFTANKNRTLVAEFEINTYTISASANPANGGTVSGGGNYNHGQSVTLKASPAEGYTFVGWKEGNSTVSSTATYTFTANKNRTLVAEFEINTYTISASANPANGGTVSGGGDYNHGQSVTLKATPAEGYTFVGWKEGNSTVSSTATYTFTANKNRTLVAEFEAISVENITLSQTILVATLGDASVQLTATITPSDALNQNIIWSSDNNGVATVNNGLINFVGVGSATITAEIDGISATCNVTVNAATVDVTGIELTPDNLTLTEGDTYTLSATILPNNATNQAINWSSNMPSVATINNGVVTAISEGAATITATTAEGRYTATCNITVTPSPRYTITFATTANGTISTTATEFKAGDEVVLTITPADGYQIVAGSLKAHKTGDASTEVVILANKFTMPHFDVTVTAEFEELTIPSPTSYTITASANPTEGGYVEGTGTYTEGTTISLKARAYAGYKFLKWTDGITAAERNITVTEDANYTAEFEADATIIIYSVTAVAEPAEGGTISGTRNYNANDYATLVAKANEGYRFVHWMSNGQELSTNIEYNFVVTQDSTLIAVFEVSPICLPTTHEFDAIACQVYEWNGQPYTTSGDHVQLFTTAAGCDSTVILHLSIQEPYNGEFTITTSNSYEWNNQTLTSSGDYVQQFTTAAGCDSTITLHLTIIEQSQTGLFDTACEQLSLSPNPTSTGFYIESANTDVRVYSISGQLVLQQSANGKTYVDISHLVAGTYIVRMGNAAAKVIKL